MNGPAEEAVEHENETLPVRALPQQRPALVAERREGEAPPMRQWVPDPDQIWLAARISAAAVLVVWLVAWPIGTTLALRETTGLWRFGLGYSGAVVILALTNSGLVLAGGYLLRAALRLEATADRLGQAVQGFEPAVRADAFRQDLRVLGGEVDAALEKLAGAERQIRDQVGLIDAATDAMRSNADSTTKRLARERQALIDATAAMNAEAEAFAAAIGQRGSAAAPEVTEQLSRLEAISRESGEQFAALREAMAEQSSLLREAPEQVASSLKGGSADLQQAQQSLLEESEKLRRLIEQQRQRADSLGKQLAAQSDRISTRRETAVKNIGGSWKRILDRVEKSAAEEPPLTTGGAKPDMPAVADLTGPERERLNRLQDLTMRLKSELFGEPSATERERFEAGDRQLFTQQMLSRDQIELRARLRAAIERDDRFAEMTETFLSEFDQLLAPIMSADPEGSEASLQEMLRAPLGQLYVLIGTAKGHFS